MVSPLLFSAEPLPAKFRRSEENSSVSDAFSKSKKTSLTITALIMSSSISNAQPAPSPSLADALNPTAPKVSVDNTDLTSALTTALTAALQLPSKKIGSTKVDVAALKSFYLLRSYKPLFVSPTGTTDTTQSLRVTLTSSSLKNGLRGNDYWSTDIESRLKANDTQSLVDIELLLAQSYLQFAADLSTGRLNPQDDSQNISDFEFRKRSFKDFALLDSIANDPSTMASQLQQLAPQNLTYATLMRSLEKLLNAKQNGGWAVLKAVKPLKPGMSDANIPLIRVRMVDLGLVKDEKERDNKSLSYDLKLATAIMAFQRALKIGSDGVIGKGTFTALSVSLDKKIDQVRANLERWRLLPRDLGERYIIVDLGQQEFSLYRSGNLDLFMRVVVGQEARQTPSFMDQVTDVVVNPYWHAPPSIIVKDVLPKAIQDPNYFDEMRIRVFQNGKEIDPYYVNWAQYSLAYPPPFEFREEPGDNNSLGRLKFNLSLNHHSIYMHDTNHKELFQEENRMYSSGCIRLEEPRLLADYLLGQQGISDYDLGNLIDNPSVIAKSISLKNPIKVYILSTTIAVDGSGSARFGHDIYDQDTRFAAALNGSRVDPAKAIKPPEDAAP
jgi:murein L,D-transpeptidase YcbB/YkuD